MLILAKKKDYYDGVVGTVGVDKTLVYDRQIVEIEDNDMPEFFRRHKGTWIGHQENPFHALAYHRLKKKHRAICDEHAHFIVGFCGKLYVGWKFYRAEREYPHRVLKTTISYDNEYVKTILEPHSYHGNLEDSLNYIQSFDALQLFRDLNAPVFVYDGDYGRNYFNFLTYNHHCPKFFINPLLKNYEFGKIFGAVQAFQEISMFMGGVLGSGEKEIVEVADKYKIAQHGFDKWSFRKEPEKKQ
jgi:hypothetical protein